MRKLFIALLALCSLCVITTPSARAMADNDDHDDRRAGLTSYASRGPIASTKSRQAVRAEAPQVYFGNSSLVNEARRYLGTNPTGRNSLWCGAFMHMVLERSGYKGGGTLASSYASYGQRIAGPQVGAIAVMSRGKGGGHVGVVSGFDASGNIMIVSGNHNHTVAEAPYPRNRIYAYVVPR